ncbi:MAG: sulfurtransferase TusA family protein [Breznakibacter sp.]
MATTELDITREHCPMTFVKTKIALSKLSKGDLLEVLVVEGEPLENIPKSTVEQGYEVLSVTHVKDNVHKITIRK